MSIEALDKIHTTLDLLSEYGYIDRYSSLKETYEKAIGIYNLERNNIEMWEMIWNHDIHSLFQMEKQSGIQGIEIIRPKSVDELAILNSVIRLMAPDKNSEQPLLTWAKYRKNINLWIDELKNYGLLKEEIDWLSNHSAITDGICESQEGLMSLVQEECLGGHSLTFADKCRKAIAKKQGKLFEECEEEFFNTIKEKSLSEKLAHYVWDVLLKVQRGYSFNRSHCLAYSLIGLQEMNLCFKYPIVFWNCACIINDSGSNEEDTNDKSTNYDKMALAMGNFTKAGIKILPPNINSSKLSFSPNDETNEIYYGLKGLTKINNDLVNSIIENRPYKDLYDFLEKVKINKPQMLSLIKSGAFDNLYPNNSRIDIMKIYIKLIDEEKNTLNLRNLASLIEFNLIPEKYSFNIRVYKYTKVLKKNFKYNDKYFVLNNDQILKFYEENFDINYLEQNDNNIILNQKVWEKIYQYYMNDLRKWLADNQTEILKQFNEIMFNNAWNKNCEGNISKWEMQSMSYYYHEHELAHANLQMYGVSDFDSLSPNPTPIQILRFRDKEIPKYKIERIAGTVIGKDKTKGIISLLTINNVVTVRFRKDFFSKYDKRISEKQSNGSKKIMEESWFARGNKIIITGIRKEDQFIPKKYKDTVGHTLYLIKNIKDNGELELQSERYTSSLSELEENNED